MAAPIIGAHAQQTGNQATGDTLEEVIVTAEKREASLQRTPIAITAVAGQDLVAAGVRDFTDINRILPNVQVFENTGATVISIRGLRAADYGPVAESPVAVHVDGVYLSRSEGLTGMFFDVQRLEVLAGPQGTLFGRNAAAGVVNIITNKPQFEYGVDATAEVGNYNLVRLESGINAPVSDTLAVRVAGQTYSHTGYLTSGLADTDQRAGRIQALWKPTDADQLLVSADVEQLGGKGPGFTLINAQTISPVVPNLRVGPAQPRDNAGFIPPGGQTDERLWGAMAQYDHQFGPSALTVQYGHRNLWSDNYLPAVTGTIAHIPQTETSNSLEARLTSSNSSTLQWVTGAYYFHEHVTGDNRTLPSFTSATFLIDIGNPRLVTDAYAAFGQLTFSPIDTLHLTAGLRYNYDQKSATTYTVFAPPPAIFSGSDHWQALNYKVGAAFDVTPASMIYANVSTGYKAGGFAYGLKPQYDPEHITAFEVGAKNRFLDNRLQVNLEGFYYDYKNFESLYAAPVVTASGPTVFSLLATNAGSATVYGSGAVVDYIVTETDKIGMDVQYLRAHYGDYNLARFHQPNYSGSDFVNAPRWQGQAYYEHAFRTAGGEFTTRFDVQSGGRREMLLAPLAPTVANPQFVMGGYTTMDFSLRYAPTAAKWHVSAYVHNLSDKIYYHLVTYTAPTAARSGDFAADLNAPRTVGVLFNTKF